MKDFLKKYWKWVALGLLLILLPIAFGLLPLKEYVQSFSDWVKDLGALGVVVFILVYALATVLCLPCFLFTIAAGVVYGIAGGLGVAMAGATLGATLAFLAGRYLVRDRVKDAANDNEKFEAVDDAIGKNGWKIVALLRLSPLIPFNAQNYFYGVTAIKLWPYVIATFVGIIPGTLMYAYLGGIGSAGLGGPAAGPGPDGQGAGGGDGGPLKWTLFAVGLIATIVVTIYVNKLAKKALEEKTDVDGENSGDDKENS